MIPAAPSRGRSAFVQLLFSPFAGLQGLLTLALVTTTCGGVLLFLFLNGTYRDLFEQRLRGLYPPLFWEGLYLEDLQSPPGDLGAAKQEKFAKSRRIVLGREGDDGYSTVFANVRAVDYGDPVVIRQIGHLIGAAPRSGEVFLSAALWETLFPDDPRREKAGASLRFPAGDGATSAKIGGVFELLNREKWIVFDAAALAAFDLSGETGSILAVYPRNEAAAQRARVAELAPGRRLFTWDERLPFFHRCLWDIVSGGIGVVGAAVGAMLGFYLVNVLGTALVEVKKNLFLLRIFGGSAVHAALAAFAGWVGVLLVVVSGGLGAVAALLGAFGSAEYRLTTADFVAFLGRVLGGTSATGGAAAAAVLALPSAAVWWMLTRKRAAGLWE